MARSQKIRRAPHVRKRRPRLRHAPAQHSHRPLDRPFRRLARPSRLLEKMTSPKSNLLRLTLLFSLCAAASVPFDAAERRFLANVRETIQIRVGESHEVWMLVWKSPPEPYCPPAEDSLMCPCTGFAYGQRG